MPLSKVEELTDTFINRGYLKLARSLLQRSEFRERSEVFIMTALYRLGTGASFRTCRALCHISTSEVQLFFDTFLQAMHEMREEYILMPTNLTQLRRISKYYEEAGLPGCCGSMNVVHVKWSACPTGDHNRAKGKGGYPSLAFQCVTDFNRFPQLSLSGAFTRAVRNDTAFGYHTLLYLLRKGAGIPCDRKHPPVPHSASFRPRAP